MVKVFPLPWAVKNVNLLHSILIDILSVIIENCRNKILIDPGGIAKIRQQSAACPFRELLHSGQLITLWAITFKVNR